MPTHLDVVVATALPAEGRKLHPRHDCPDLTLSFRGARRNFALDLPQIAAAFGSDLPPTMRDMLEIAASVYAADLAFARGANEAWVRSARFLIPVRQPDFWQAREPLLAEALYVLTHDSFAFDFCARAEPDDEPLAPPGARLSGVDCVSLLSGGLDSLAGAAMLLATDRRPLFVAHRPQNPTIVASQEHVRHCLAEAFGRAPDFVAIACSPARGSEGRVTQEAAASDVEYPYPPAEARETSQRTRSFLYMTLGVMGCLATGAGELFCPENGVLTVNLPLTEARVGGYSTAGARPQTLAAFGRLLAALGVGVSIQNPFLYQTKGQLVRDILRRYLPPEAIQGTVSCWMAGRLSRPCGSCVPCLVRAIAMHSAGLPREAHAVDPFSTGAEAGAESGARANLVDLLTLVGRLQRLSDLELFRAYPTLLALAPEANVSGVVRMLRRFADEARAAIGEPDFTGGGSG